MHEDCRVVLNAFMVGWFDEGDSSKIVSYVRVKGHESKHKCDV